MKVSIHCIDDLSSNALSGTGQAIKCLIKYLPNYTFDDENCDVLLCTSGIDNDDVTKRINRVKDKSKFTIVLYKHCMYVESCIDVLKDWISRGFKIKVIGVSNYSLSDIKHFNLESYIVHLGLDKDIFNGIGLCDEYIRKGRNVFHAAFERGGIMASRICDNNTLHVASYSKCNGIPNTCKFYGALNKSDIKRLLGSCEYFIYPLTLGDGRVHHDTFACCVLEALACGVIVITYDVAALREVYGEYLQYIDTYPSYKRNASFVRNDTVLHSDVMISKFKDRIRYIESNKHLKESLRVRGMAWALSQLSMDDCCKNVSKIILS